MEDKDHIRKRMLTLRSEIPNSERMAACGYICEKLLSIPLVPNGIVAAYFPIRSEADITQAINTLCLRNYSVCVPTVTVPEKMMKFVEFKPNMRMRQGTFGTIEPAVEKLVVPTTVWMPLVAFDRRGNRLGYGGGYYDVTLAQLKRSDPNLRIIGVAFSLQEVEKLPYESHDMKFDLVVTEKEIITP